jgi:ketosteroid isomerase-like protein
MAYDAPSAEGADERSSDGGTSMSDNATFLEGLYGSFAQGDVPKVLAAMDPEIEWNEAEHVTFWTGKPFVGPDAVVQGVFARIGETFGDTFRIEISRLLECGSTVVMEGRYKGVVQATGKHLDVQVTHHWDLADGKVVKFQQYTDTWQWSGATGETPVG